MNESSIVFRQKNTTTIDLSEKNIGEGIKNGDFCMDGMKEVN